MNDLLGRLGRYLIKCITIDSRTLALFRISMGLLIIGDVLARASTFTFFYTEDGVVPQELAEARTVDSAFSFFFWTQNSTVIALLFLLHFLVAIQLIIGYKSRIAMVVSFLFIISLDHHNPLILSHADTLFRLIAFWAMFVPLGERWSIDALQRERAPHAEIASLGTVAILLQMIYMYSVNGVHKLNSVLWNSREATPLIFGLDDMTYFLAGPMRQYPFLLEILGTMWYYLLVGSIVMLFLPGRMRAVMAFMYFMAHFSFTVTVRIGGFGWIAMGGVLLFLPSQFWDDMKALAVRFNFWDRVVVPVRDGLTRFGERAAAILPSLQPRLAVPAALRDGVYDIGMTFLIIAHFIFPSLVFLANEDVIEWQQSSIEERIASEFRKFGVVQSQWTVFAPNPRTTDRYYVFAALTVDGELLDVYNDRPFTFGRPYDELQNIYGNYRERFYMNTIRRAGNTGAPPQYLADYICRDYLDRGIELTHMDMWVVNERVTRETIADHRNRPTSSELMSSHSCGTYEPQRIELPEDPP